MTPTEAAQVRAQLEAMEARARQDPDLRQKPVFASRYRNVVVANQELVFGPDWRKDIHERRCSLCHETVIVRPVFAECPTVVCLTCAPGFLEAYLHQKGATA